MVYISLQDPTMNLSVTARTNSDTQWVPNTSVGYVNPGHMPPFTTSYICGWNGGRYYIIQVILAISCVRMCYHKK